MNRPNSKKKSILINILLSAAPQLWGSFSFEHGNVRNVDGA